MSSPEEIAVSTLADQCYRAIRNRVMDGRIAVGEFVREQDLCASLGVSRTPIREAMGRLASEGLLERIPHRGYRVPEEAFERLKELYPIVSALELLAGRLAFPNVKAADRKQLRSYNRELRTALQANSVDEAIAANERFHGLISQRSGNQRLSEQLVELRSQLRPLERWYYSSKAHGKQSVQEHTALIKALSSGDLLQALEIFEHNMALTLVSLSEQAQRFSQLDD